jgi:NAD(P)H-dependent flavin oxidoreductase YrpB (nitropropane dioxygenase family)
MAAALAAGADAGRVGTRFVASEAAGVHEPTPRRCVYTRTFHVGWPEAPHRVLRSSIDAAEAFQSDIVGQVVALDGAETAVSRFGTRMLDRTATGEVVAMSFYAGESVGGVKRILPAREFVRELVEEAEQLLRPPR